MDKLTEEIDLNNFIFNNQQIIVILDKDNNPWFYGNQIAKILGYDRRPKDAINIVNEKYIKTYSELLEVINKEIKLPIITIQNISKFINEMGLYQLIMKSTLPMADRFQEWIFEVVLTSIKKYKEKSLNKKMEVLLILNEDLNIQLKNEMDISKRLYNILQKEIDLNNNLYATLLKKYIDNDDE